MSEHGGTPQELGAKGRGEIPGDVLLERLESLVVSCGDGTSEVDTAGLRKLVREAPEACVAACRAFASLAVDGVGSPNSHARYAFLIATAYEAEFDDDALSAWVAAELEAGGVRSGPPRLVEELPEGSGEEVQPVLVMRVSPEMLAGLDIYPLVLCLSYHGLDEESERLARIRSMRGRVVISFDVPPDDPREVWQVPQIRAYMNKLSDALPYLPYYFYPGPQFAMTWLWLCCIAPPSAWTQEGLDLRDESVVVSAAYAMHSSEALAELLGDDPDEVRATVFGSLPEEFEGFTAFVSSIVDQLADSGEPRTSESDA